MYTHSFLATTALTWPEISLINTRTHCQHQVKVQRQLKKKAQHRQEAQWAYTTHLSWWPHGFREDFCYFLLIISQWMLYLLMATRVPIKSALKPYATFPPTWWRFTRNLIRIGQLTLDTVYFENVDGGQWQQGILISDLRLPLRWAYKS